MTKQITAELLRRICENDYPPISLQGYDFREPEPLRTLVAAYNTCPEITELYLCHNGIRTISAIELGSLRYITRLDLSFNSISDDWVDSLAGLQQLEHLTLNTNYIITEKFALILLKLPNLKTLRLGGGNEGITQEFQEKIDRALSDPAYKRELTREILALSSPTSTTSSKPTTSTTSSRAFASATREEDKEASIDDVKTDLFQTRFTEGTGETTPEEDAVTTSHSALPAGLA